MITQGEDVGIHALGPRGWSISAVARHVGADRETVRACLAGDREVGVRRRSGAGPFAAVEDYVRRRPLQLHPQVRFVPLGGTNRR